MQQPIPDTERDAIFERLRQNHDNNKCLDCEKKNPKWASVYFGIFLCIDCAGKHREYGASISFVRSLTLDSWSRRQICFFENGGNTKVLDYFKKNGLKAPYDYKSPTVQKYKQDLTKKVDIILEAESKGQFTTISNDKTLTQNNQTNPVKMTTTTNPVIGNGGVITTNTLPIVTQNETQPTNETNFFENISLKKPNSFVVEFNKEKPQFGAAKGSLQAKRIANFDLSNLTLEESDGQPTVKTTPNFSMTDTAIVTSPSISENVPVKEIKHNTGYTDFQDREAEQKMKKYENAKAISSEMLYGSNDKKEESLDIRRFNGATAISSAQVFGNGEEEDSGDYGGENIKDLFTKVGGKLKEKAGAVITKLKNDWETN